MSKESKPCCDPHDTRLFLEKKEGELISSPIFASCGYTYVTYTLRPFQPSYKGGNWLRHLEFNLSFDEDPELSGIIDHFELVLRNHDDEDVFYKMDEVSPEDLFWLGEMCRRVAEHYGVTADTIKKQEGDCTGCGEDHDPHECPKL